MCFCMHTDLERENVTDERLCSTFFLSPAWKTGGTGGLWDSHCWNFNYAAFQLLAGLFCTKWSKVMWYWGQCPRIATCKTVLKSGRRGLFFFPKKRGINLGLQLWFTAEKWYWVAVHFQSYPTYVSYSFDLFIAYLCVNLTVNILLDLSSGLAVNAYYLWETFSQVSFYSSGYSLQYFDVKEKLKIKTYIDLFCLEYPHCDTSLMLKYCVLGSKELTSIKLTMIYTSQVLQFWQGTVKSLDKKLFTSLSFYPFVLLLCVQEWN